MKQHNALTAARYDYSLWEKRIIYYLINQVRIGIESGRINKTIFEHLLINLDVQGILRDDSKNYHMVKKAAKSLRLKSFELETGEFGDEDYEWWECGFINSTKIGRGVLEVEVNKLVLPYLYELMNNFTTYSLVVAMSLKSLYSQRFYEFCSRFKDTGKWNVTVSDLRQMLMLENKYPRYLDFKNRILEVARKELGEMYDEGQCDVCFGYEEIKTKREVTHLHFWVKWNKKNKGANESTPEELQLVGDYIRKFWPSNEKRARGVFKAIHEAKAFKEFMDKADEILERYQPTRAENLGGILTNAMREDYQLII